MIKILLYPLLFVLDCVISASDECVCADARKYCGNRFKARCLTGNVWKPAQFFVTASDIDCIHSHGGEMEFSCQSSTIEGSRRRQKRPRGAALERPRVHQEGWGAGPVRRDPGQRPVRAHLRLLCRGRGRDKSVARRRQTFQ